MRFDSHSRHYPSEQHPEMVAQMTTQNPHGAGLGDIAVI